MDKRDEKSESLDRYPDPNLETLGEFLDQLWDDGAMDLEELDGFFAALHCCPEPILPGEYLPEVLGPDDAPLNAELFPNPETSELFFSLILNHWNAVSDALNSDDSFMPLLLEDDDGIAHGHHWAVGFLRGVDMRKQLWSEVLENQEMSAWFNPLLALAEENEPGTDPELRPEIEPMTEEQRETLLSGISVSVAEIYKYFALHRKLNAAERKEQQMIRPISKIGRNDLCYCGSGKKYKKCCGALNVN